MATGKKKYILIVLLLAAIAGGAVLASRLLKHRDNNVIAVSGNIELTEVNISFKVSGKLVERNVDEGDPVKKGMVVARLDQEQLQRQRDRASAALESNKSQLVQLRTDIQFQRESVEGQIQQRQAELNQAEASLRDLLAGSRPQEIKESAAAVAQARTDYENAKDDWERVQKLSKNEDISAQQYDQYRMRFGMAQAALQAAEQRLAIVKEGPRAEAIVGARAAVARAQAALKLAQAQRLQVTEKEQEVQTRTAEIDRAKADLGLIDAQLQDPIAISPIDGVVLTKAAEVGEVLAPGTTVVTAGDLDHPWLRAYINEQDLGRLKLGNKVKVTTDSFPGKVYWGRVSFISDKAEFTPKQIQTEEERVKLVYRIKIDIANPAHELKSNMPADAQILLDQQMADPWAPNP